jgi:hypothetical protein
MTVEHTHMTRTRRCAGILVVVAIATLATFFGPITPAHAGDRLCTTAELQNPGNFDRCVNAMAVLTQEQATCVKAPTPSEPDSGMAGWFTSRSAAYDQSGPKLAYTEYGYAGYDYTTYDIGCVQTTMHPDYKLGNMVANGEFMVATGILGAANAVREKAWDPHSVWGWADPLVERLTRAIYERVFTPLGAITLAIVGVYLLWRARQADMNHMITTAGWAVMVIVVVTAVARYPVWSANLADHALTGSLGTIHKALSAAQPPTTCTDSALGACVDHRPPAQVASDTVTNGLVYRNWLRGELGSADSATAQRYGYLLYSSKVITWGEADDIRKDPSQRKVLFDQKERQWNRTAAQIKTEDPEAYEYLQGTHEMDRIGAGFVAILAALSFAAFDLAASLLILIGFLIFRWAVIALPLLGTIAILRPASGSLRRVVNVVVGSVLNIVIFGTGAAIYVFFVDQILSTRALAGWLQVLLIFLTGIVGWIVLRPHRRMRHIGGQDPIHIARDVAIGGAVVDRAAARLAKAAASKVTP